MKVIMVSKSFLKGHPKAGEPTHFLSKIENALIGISDIELMPCDYKKHTIRAGKRFKEGERVSLRYWSDKPYRSKQIEFAQVIIRKVYDIEINIGFVTDDRNIGSYFHNITINDELINSNWTIQRLANNDGLTLIDFFDWFKNCKNFDGQIICWVDPKY